MPASKLHSSRNFNYGVRFPLTSSSVRHLSRRRDKQWVTYPRGKCLVVCTIAFQINRCVYAKAGTEPFRSRANSLPGANQPIALWPIRSLANSLPGHFAPWPFRSLAILLPGTFAPWIFRSVALSLRMVKITIYCEKNSYKEIKVT